MKYRHMFLAAALGAVASAAHAGPRATRHLARARRQLQVLRGVVDGPDADRAWDESAK